MLSGPLQALPMYPFLLQFICILYNKPVTSKCRPEVCEPIEKTTKPEGRGCPGIPEFIAGGSELQVAQDLGLVSKVGLGLWLAWFSGLNTGL